MKAKSSSNRFACLLMLRCGEERLKHYCYCEPLRSASVMTSTAVKPGFLAIMRTP
jgi:hypothetical protein